MRCSRAGCRLRLRGGRYGRRAGWRAPREWSRCWQGSSRKRDCLARSQQLRGCRPAARSGRKNASYQKYLPDAGGDIANFGARGLLKYWADRGGYFFILELKVNDEVPHSFAQNANEWGSRLTGLSN